MSGKNGTPIYLFVIVSHIFLITRHEECSNLTEAKWDYIYGIIITMCFLGYHHNGENC